MHPANSAPGFPSYRVVILTILHVRHIVSFYVNDGSISLRYSERVLWKERASLGCGHRHGALRDHNVYHIRDRTALAVLSKIRRRDGMCPDCQAGVTPCRRPTRIQGSLTEGCGTIKKFD